MAAPQYIKVSYINNEAIVEAWMKWVILPSIFVEELKLDCFPLFNGTAVVKQNLEKRVRKIEDILSNKATTDVI